LLAAPPRLGLWCFLKLRADGRGDVHSEPSRSDNDPWEATSVAMEVGMFRKALRWQAVLLVVGLVTLLAATPVLAFEARGGDTVAVASAEVVDDDLYVGANTVNVDGAVKGDLWAVGNTVMLNGPVGGGVVALGQRVTVSGDADRAVRVAGQTVSVSGTVAGDLVVAGSEVYVTGTAVIRGDLYVAAGSVRIDGVVEGDVMGGAGDVVLANEVEGNVELKVESLTLLSTANVHGDLTYTSEEELDMASEAIVGGEIEHNVPEVEEDREPFPFILFGGVLAKVIGFLVAFIAGLVLILWTPKRLTSIADSIASRPGKSAGWGALVLFAVPIGAIIVCFTIVGIAVGVIALALWGVAIYLAQVPVGLLIGRLVLGRFRAVQSRGLMLAALALGLLILKLLSLIPYVGFFITLAAMVFGLGAAVVWWREQRVRLPDEAAS